MDFTFECPTCKKLFDVSRDVLAKKPSNIQCCACGDAPPPDIMTAYQSVGKTMSDLYGCCECNNKAWLPKEVKVKSH